MRSPEFVLCQNWEVVHSGWGQCRGHRPKSRNSQQRLADWRYWQKMGLFNKYYAINKSFFNIKWIQRLEKLISFKKVYQYFVWKFDSVSLRPAWSRLSSSGWWAASSRVASGTPEPHSRGWRYCWTWGRDTARTVVTISRKRPRIQSNVYRFCKTVFTISL